MQLYDYFSPTGHKPVLLLKVGRKYLHVLLNDGTLVVKRLPVSDWDYLTPIADRRALAKFRKLARKQGVRNLSRGVRQALGV